LRIAGLVVAVVLGFAVVGCDTPTKTVVSGQSGQVSPTETTQPAKLTNDTFNDTCQGASVSRAKAYDKSAATHKVLYFESFADTVVQFPKDLPDDWQVPLDAPAETLGGVDLVVCALRTADTFHKTCNGYTDNSSGAVTGDVVNLHDASYKVTVHDPQTGNVLASTDVNATNDSCPTSVKFENGEKSIEFYAPVPRDQLVAIVKPYAQP
jgi:hypothetical protein